MNQPSNNVILIADDDPSQLMLSEAALAGAGYIVHTVADGEEAVQKFGEVNPDCVVLDVNMPKLSGIEACRAIRAKAGSRPLPILMLTGRNVLPAITDAYGAGANDFAQKGMNPRLLVERVRFLLRDRNLREELRSSQSKLLLAQRIARVGHWEVGFDGRSLHVSPMVAELLGVEPVHLGRYEDFVALLDPAEQEVVRAAFVTCATGNGGFGFDHRIRTSDGNVIALHQEAELIGGPDDRVIIVTLQDLTRLHRAEETVRLLSYFDTVTGLPNRRHLAEQVAHCLTEPGAPWRRAWLQSACTSSIASHRPRDASSPTGPSCGSRGASRPNSSASGRAARSFGAPTCRPSAARRTANSASCCAAACRRNTSPR
jgi:DNA-binding response OmpR family regulator